ncbi:MAG: acyltransferase family protein, partial [Magnetospiraceae bacterium]
GVSGGFAGVDVFFVISGYLITGILVQQAESGGISILNFYARRAKRILPALIAVLLACIAAAGWLLTPLPMADFGLSLAAALGFAANFHFRDHTGYFDLPAHEQPLLHTWSLSVEEQYYLIWPLLLMALFAWGSPRLRRGVLGVLLLLSLILSEWQAQTEPVDAFFLLPARLWELLLGGFVALEGQRRIGGPLMPSVLAGIGAGLVLLSMVWLTGSDPFPGLHALLPCGGTALILYAGLHGGGPIRRVLSLQPVLFVGLISYSLYLWHWPMIVFYREWTGPVLSGGEQLVLALAAMAVSAFSWRFIEQPIRRLDRQRFRDGRVVRLAAVAILCVGGLGLSAHFGDGWAFRVPPSVVAFERQSAVIPRFRTACHGSNLALVNDAACGFGAARGPGGYDMVLFGDSHGDHFSATAARLADARGLSGRQVTSDACLPLWGVTHHTPHGVGYCGHLRRAMDDFMAANPNLKLIILAGRWALYTEGNTLAGVNREPSFLADSEDPVPGRAASRRVLARGMAATVKKLRARGAEVLILGQAPPFPAAPNTCLARALWRGTDQRACGEDARAVEAHLAASNHLILQIAAADPGVFARLPSRALCRNGRCDGQIDGVPLYLDDDHLNQPGSAKLYDLLDLGMFDEPEN